MLLFLPLRFEQNQPAKQKPQLDSVCVYNNQTEITGLEAYEECRRYVCTDYSWKGHIAKLQLLTTPVAKKTTFDGHVAFMRTKKHSIT